MSYTFTKKALAVCIVCVWSEIFATPSGIHSFTNHAGHVVTGQLTSISNGFARIGERTFPLTIFPKSEIDRMYGLLDVARPLPSTLLERRKFLRDRYLRNEALEKAGAKTPEEAAARRESLRKAWIRAVESCKDLDAPMRRAALRLSIESD